MDEIYAKVKRLKAKSVDNLKDYLTLRPIPIIIGNKGQFYLIDHHLTYTVWQAFKDIYLPVEVVKNWTQIEGYHFWKAMVKHNNLYPFAGDGAGPLPPDKLKGHIEDLENDIFRSLSWVVRSNYGYLKTMDNAIFTEFKWGNFSRERISFNMQMKHNQDIRKLTLTKIRADDEGDYEKLISLALSLAKSKEAAELPGYRGQ